MRSSVRTGVRLMTIKSGKHDVILAAATFAFFIFVYAALCGSARSPFLTGEVPLAFWSWRTRTPEPTDINRIFGATNAKLLFQRAGQFDVAGGKVVRIRPVAGLFPRTVETHLVYNATRKFLSEFETLQVADIATGVTDTYDVDLKRARSDGAKVAGIQLDLDVPTRLLPKYAELLKLLRSRFRPETALSITGLPTWTDSNDLIAVLKQVNFWIPQFYGSTIPDHIDERIAISSTGRTVEFLKRVRKLDKPFYAGVSAYGYAILYGRDGALVEIRGDIDPALAHRHIDLEFIERQSFPDGSREMRYIYRAKQDLTIDGLVIENGETLVFDVPNLASLQADLRAVRENAGEHLEGICIFRLPTSEDATSLNAELIASALHGEPPRTRTDLKLNRTSATDLKLLVMNTGNTSSALDQDAVVVDLSIPRGFLGSATSISNFTLLETLCGDPTREPRACSAKRANILRLHIIPWNPGDRASLIIKSGIAPSAPIHAFVTVNTDDGSVSHQSFDLPISNMEK